MKNAQNLIIALVVAAAIVAGAWIHGMYLYNSRQHMIVKVLGFASKKYSADIVKWSINTSKVVGVDKLKEGFKTAEKDLKLLKAYLAKKGIKEESISIQPPQSMPVYDQNGISGYTVGQTIKVTSTDINKIEALALAQTEIMDTGISMTGSTLEYYISNLSEVKKILIAEATKDSKERASEIVKSSGQKLGKLTSARTGVFQITEPLSNEVADYGIYNSQSREKEVKITVNAEYELE